MKRIGVVIIGLAMCAAFVAAAAFAMCGMCEGERHKHDAGSG